MHMGEISTEVALRVAHARGRLDRGQMPYWSGAANEASERTAPRAGFACCKESFYAEAVKKTDAE